MKKQTLQTAYGGINAALSLLLVFCASIAPTGKAMIMLASGAGIYVLLKAGMKLAAVLSFIAAGVLAVCFMPVYGGAYLLFFGAYPFLSRAMLNKKPAVRFTVLAAASWAAVLIMCAGAYFLLQTQIAGLPFPICAVLCLPASCIAVAAQECVAYGVQKYLPEIGK